MVRPGPPGNLLTITAVLWTAAPVDPDRFRALVAEVAALDAAVAAAGAAGREA